MKRPCIERGCPELTTTTRCEAHRKAKERARGAGRGTTAQRGYGGGWQSLRLAVLERDGNRCRWCRDVATQVDHVVPKAHGGTDDPSNLVASCGRCNSVRGGMTRRPG